MKWLLLAYGVPLCLPDLALPLGEVVRICLDNALVALLLCITGLESMFSTQLSSRVGLA